MKRGVLFLLLFVLTVSFFSFVSCQKQLQPEIPEGDFTPKVEGTPTPCRCQPTLFIWWAQESNDQRLLQDAWYDFRDIYIANNSGNLIDTGHNHLERLNMFSMEADVNGTTQLEQQIMAGTAPDMVRMDHVYITTLGQKGLVFDLQEKWQATDELSERFIPSTWEACSSGDAVYGIPFDANTIIFGAKTSALQQAGVSIPTNYEELRMVGAEMRNSSAEQMPYFLPIDGLSSAFSITPYFMTWLWRLGGDLLNEDLTKATFNDPDTGVKALQMMLQLKEDGILATDAHEDGKTAMSDYGTWWMQGFTEDMEFSLQPALKDGGPRYSGLGVYGLAIVTTAKEPQAAYEFAVHLATEQNSVTKQHYVYNYCRNHNLIPALKDAAKTSEIWNADSIEGDFWRTSIQQLELSKYRPAVPCWPEIEEALTSAIYCAWLGEKTPQQALDDAAEIANRLLEEWSL